MLSQTPRQGSRSNTRLLGVPAAPCGYNSHTRRRNSQWNVERQPFRSDSVALLASFSWLRRLQDTFVYSGYLLQANNRVLVCRSGAAASTPHSTRTGSQGSRPCKGPTSNSGLDAADGGRYALPSRPEGPCQSRGGTLPSASQLSSLQASSKLAHNKPLWSCICCTICM